MAVHQFLTISLLSLALMVQAKANTQCTLSDKWVPFERDIAWRDYVDNPQLSNRVQLLNIWAIWCAPCRKELPILAKLDALPNIDVHLLNMGDEPEQAQAMLEELSVASLSASVSDNPALLEEFGVVGIPLTVMFIDGEAAYRYLGILKDDETIEHYGQCLSASYE